MITYEFHLSVKWYYEPKITIDVVPYDRKFRKYDCISVTHNKYGYYKTYRTHGR